MILKKNKAPGLSAKMDKIDRKKKIKKAIAVQERLSKKSGQWDGVAEIRKWRDKRWGDDRNES